MRETFLPFAKPSIAQDGIDEVVNCIKSGWLTIGPKTIAFEQVFKDFTTSPYCIGVNSATAGLHLVLMALGIGKGDEVITTPMTFASTVNTIILAGATPVLADIDRRNLNIVPANIEAKITPKTKAIMPVHFAGRPCDMKAIREIAKKHNLIIIEDAAHALGAKYQGERIGKTDGKNAVVFSFHPTKNITTGEGGMVCLSDEAAAEAVYIMRQNGMSKGAWNRYAAKGKTHYDISLLGLKYNMLDIQAAIGISQMKQLEDFNKRRTEIVAKYMAAFKDTKGLILPAPVNNGDLHSWHIFTPLIDTEVLNITRDEFMKLMGEQNIGTALHYQAIPTFSYYQKTFGWNVKDYPEAEYVGEHIVSLPLFPAMTDKDIEDVISTTKQILKEHLK